MFESFSLILPSRRTNTSTAREGRARGMQERTALLKNKLQGEKEWRCEWKDSRKEQEIVFYHNISTLSSTLKSVKN